MLPKKLHILYKIYIIWWLIAKKQSIFMTGILSLGDIEYSFLLTRLLAYGFFFFFLLLESHFTVSSILCWVQSIYPSKLVIFLNYNDIIMSDLSHTYSRFHCLLSGTTKSILLPILFWLVFLLLLPLILYAYQVELEGTVTSARFENYGAPVLSAINREVAAAFA